MVMVVIVVIVMSSLFFIPNMDEWPRTAAGISGVALGTFFGGLVVGGIQPTNIVLISSALALAVVTLLLLVMNLSAWVLNDVEGGDGL